MTAINWRLLPGSGRLFSSFLVNSLLIITLLIGLVMQKLLQIITQLVQMRREFSYRFLQEPGLFCDCVR